MLKFTLERFKKLPQRSGTVWQGGLYRMPAWTAGDDGKPIRPQMALWADVPSGLVSQPVFVEAEKPFDTALKAMLDFALNHMAHRPITIQVANPELASFMKENLADTCSRVECVASQPAIQALLGELAGHLNKRAEPPAALSGTGVGVGQMRAFADAAARFCVARPWDELTGEDLIVVEKPESPAGMAYVSVIGNAGQSFGLGFFDSIKQFEKMHRAASPGRFFAHQGVWSLSFDDITYLPFADADLWEEHRLPLAGENAYPFVSYFGAKKQMRRPNAEELAFIEGLLLAFADTTVEQLDQARWTCDVNRGGQMTGFTLALVDPLEKSEPKGPRDVLANPLDLRRAMEKSIADLQRTISEQEFESIDEVNDFIARSVSGGKSKSPAAQSDLDRAQELMYEAWDARGRRRRSLARQALEISPDCADAYVLLAEESGSPTAACEFFQKGVEAGERALGRKTFKDDVGYFWGLLETRPYMRARFGLAQCLWEIGRKDEAIAHYEELLRLNPGDNQGVRYLLAACLLQTGDGEKLESLFRQYQEEKSTQWLYVRALWAYRKEGDSQTARKHAKVAIKSNTHVPAFLSGRRRLPATLPDSFRWGHEDEAMICAAELLEEWRAAPGAIDWLAKQQRPARVKN